LHTSSTFVTQVVRLILIFSAASASYYLVERRFLRLKRRFERRPDRPTEPVAGDVGAT
jgi:peptidoglycan/LPS O-acetylase OafA/YrhL